MLQYEILPLRSQFEIRNRWLQRRLDTLLPELMAREQLDMWLIIANEYNEDPVMLTLLPAPAMTARRRAILVFCRNQDGSVDRLTLDRYGYGDFYESIWNPDQEEQDDCLARLVQERNPQAIGINVSDTFAFGDGLTHNEYLRLTAALGDDYMSRTRGVERLCVGWLERRIEAEITAYPNLVEMGHALIAQAFSSHVIHPGITTKRMSYGGFARAYWTRVSMLGSSRQ